MISFSPALIGARLEQLFSLVCLAVCLFFAVNVVTSPGDYNSYSEGVVHSFYNLAQSVHWLGLAVGAFWIGTARARYCRGELTEHQRSTIGLRSLASFRAGSAAATVCAIVGSLVAIVLGEYALGFGLGLVAAVFLVVWFINNHAIKNHEAGESSEVLSVNGD